MTSITLFRLRARSYLFDSLLLFFSINLILGIFAVPTGYAETANGEIENRPAPVARRKCIGGANAGNLCNENADCPGSSCVDRNVYNISVAVQFNATNVELDAVKNLISAGSAVLFDVTDGQAEIGEAFIYNNAAGTSADLRIYPSSNPTWWQANTGSWKNGGSIHVSIDNVQAESAPGESFAHEFVHLVFDARDEYESRPGCGSTTYSGDSCPDPDNIPPEASCLMDNGGTGASDGPFSELCWGQADNTTNPPDTTNGNHDADNTTEQSQCRSNRSCWDQVEWSWPNTIKKPAAAPDPGVPGGAVVHDAQFVEADSITRVVLVLDESGSMSLEDPSRLERLKVAAKDFVNLAENGTELGIVSYSDDAEAASGRVNLAIDALDAAHRAACIAAIDGLDDIYRTNIGSGLQKAHDMIDAAGGVTANTYIVLMTDGVNNEPAPQADADADLNAKVADLLADNVPVYVTCTGSDLGLDSQCSEIAAGTNGFYVDSSDSAKLPEAFVDLHEKISGREIIDSAEGMLSKAETKTIFMEKDSLSATFTLLWQDKAASASMTAIDPHGHSFKSISMPQGCWIRVLNPVPGDWQIRISKGATDSRYVLRAYSRSQTRSLVAAVRYPSVLPGEDIYVYAYPRAECGAISKPGAKLSAKVTLPDGSTDTLELHDQGRDSTGQGDDLPADGIFTGVYKNTLQKGAYQFQIDSFFDVFVSVDVDPRGKKCTLAIAPFAREVRLSAAVGDPNDVETTPEDGFPFCTNMPKLCEKRVAQVPIPWQFWGIVPNPTGGGSIVTDRIRLSPTWLKPLPGDPGGAGPVYVQRWAAVARDVFPLEKLVWDFRQDRPGLSLDWHLIDDKPVEVDSFFDITFEIQVSSVNKAVLVAYKVFQGEEVVGHFINEAILQVPPASSAQNIVEILINFDVHNDTGYDVTNFELDFHGLNFGCGDVKWATGFISGQGQPPAPVPYEPWGTNEKNDLVVRPLPTGGAEVKWIEPERPLKTCEWLHVGLVFSCNDFDCFNNPDNSNLRATVQGYWTVIDPKDCDDKNPCTVDFCDFEGNCRHIPVPDGYSCETDGNLCTTGACYKGECMEKPVNCEDGDLCTYDKCEPDTGHCIHTPLICDDANRCTIDRCEPVTGECKYEPINCDDGNPCTIDECNPKTGECLYTAKNCDDNNACTKDWCDSQTGECKHDPMNCDDGDPCTIDSCENGRCLHKPKCDDGNPCTIDQCDPKTGQCIHTPNNCDDRNPCTEDSCDPKTGLCLHINKPDSDRDGICDEKDNCILIYNPNQCDTNGDGYGNICDPDINNDCYVNTADLAALKAAFGTCDGHLQYNKNADFNCDKCVNTADLAILKKYFGKQPGPGQGSCK
ncbi:MAG: VWA domain-containing protein [Candidatus Schekmanbacteria bacterium]|nr:VWA domain-containing protein [Candidatus Schekmanbacteria bacterium]